MIYLLINIYILYLVLSLLLSLLLSRGEDGTKNICLLLKAKYAFLGAIRSTAAMISYELVLSSCVLIIIFFSATFDFDLIIENQQAV